MDRLPVQTSPQRRSSGGPEVMRIRTWAKVALAIGSLAMTALPQSRLPRFEDYLVASVYPGKIHPPDFGNPNQYSGTDLNCFGGNAGDFDYSKYKPNFSGHYVI